MLIEVSIENYKSIKNKVTLSMQKSSQDKTLDENFVNIELNKIGQDKKEIGLLKTSAIYGANASGKSNIIDGILKIKLIILNSHAHQQGQLFPVVPFKLDDKCVTEPTFFQFVFIEQGVKYAYNVKLTKKSVVEENLYYYPNGREQKVFSREGNEIKINFGSQKQLDKEAQLRQEIYASDISENILFLSLANRVKIDAVKNAFNWFANKLQVVTKDLNVIPTTTPMLTDNQLSKEQVLKYLKIADSQIQGINIEANEFNINDPNNSDIKKHLMFEAQRRNIPFEKMQVEPLMALVEKTQRHGLDIDGNVKNVDFTLQEESLGTAKFYNLIGPIIQELNNGMVIIYDEFDTSLHPLLVKGVIELFYSKVNCSHAQLIMSTHNAYFLDFPALFRRDQVWVTEKQYNGETELYSISDFKGIKRSNLSAKTYLKGKFGGIPQIDLDDIYEE